jgi:molybdate transport system ATP-binding protein
VIVLDFTLTQGTFTLEIRQRVEARVVALFGASGAGKTTILDAIAGLRRPASGTIAVGDHVLFSSQAGVDRPPHLRRVGYVTQDVALFPHMNVRRNLSYGRRRGGSLSLDDVAGMLEIAGLLDRSVSQLSGGERQRIALGRALMSGPEILLLDEPLAAVDVELRRRILPYLQRIRDSLAIPIVYVTHAVEEVRQLADAVLLVDGGVVRSEAA